MPLCVCKYAVPITNKCYLCVLCVCNNLGYMFRLFLYRQLLGLYKKPKDITKSITYFYCYTVHVVELLNYYTNHCTYIKFLKFTH